MYFYIMNVLNICPRHKPNNFTTQIYKSVNKFQIAMYKEIQSCSLNKTFQFFVQLGNICTFIFDPITEANFSQ